MPICTLSMRALQKFWSSGCHNKQPGWIRTSAFEEQFPQATCAEWYPSVFGTHASREKMLNWHRMQRAVKPINLCKVAESCTPTNVVSISWCTHLAPDRSLRFDRAITFTNVSFSETLRKVTFFCFGMTAAIYSVGLCTLQTLLCHKPYLLCLCYNMYECYTSCADWCAKTLKVLAWKSSCRCSMPSHCSVVLGALLSCTNDCQARLLSTSGLLRSCKRKQVRLCQLPAIAMHVHLTAGSEQFECVSIRAANLSYSIRMEPREIVLLNRKPLQTNLCIFGKEYGRLCVYLKPDCQKTGENPPSPTVLTSLSMIRRPSQNKPIGGPYIFVFGQKWKLPVLHKCV